MFYIFDKILQSATVENRYILNLVEVWVDRTLPKFALEIKSDKRTV